jgi:hypothetical protein
MLAQWRFFGLGQAAQIDDTLYCGGGSRIGHVAGGAAIGLDKSCLLSDHGMHQIICCAAAFSRFFKRLTIERIALNQFQHLMPGPGATSQFVQRPSHGAHPQAGFKQRRNQTPADITRGTGNEDGLGFHFLSLQNLKIAIFHQTQKSDCNAAIGQKMVV